MHEKMTFFIALAVSCVYSSTAGGQQQAGFRESLQPFFASYCNDCHADGQSEGGLALDQLNADLSDEATFARWERIFDRVAKNEMPPADSDQPTDRQLADFVKLLGDDLVAAHTAHKGTVLRRLNRREYQNTMNDLFGTHLDLESRLPEDGRSHEFNNVGESLSISMVQLQRYLEAADSVLESAIATTTEPPEVTTKRATYAETREGEKHIGQVWKKLDDGAVVFFRSGGYPSGMLRTANTRATGRYRIRVTGYAHQSKEPITFAVGSTSFQRGSQKPTYGYFAFPPDEPTTIELEAWIEKNYMIDITPWGIGTNFNEVQKNGVDKYSGPGLAIQHVDLEGPLVDQFPSRGHRLIFDGLDRREIEPRNPNEKKRSWYQPQFEIVSDAPRQDAEKVLQRVATLAFRRPTASSDIEAYGELFATQMADGATFEDALRTAIAAIFCSPDFLYLREPSGWLDDHAVATRLSYFLTRTTPDEPLLEAARSGSLSKDPQLLLAHTRRLLNDPRHQRFIEDFTDAWLNLREIEFTNPDQNLFPEFDRFLQYSMIEETRGFFAKLIEDNAPVVDLVQSDFTLLNNRLAAHYGIDGITHPDVRPTPLPADSVRGGLLGQASILKVSANGTNTSPVVRGVWVMERMLGETAPPPPSGVPGVEPDIRGASTLRELLAKHRNLDACRSCHTLIDPPGFAMESFNPIGGWRENYRSLGDGERIDLEIDGRKVRYRRGPVVDASGELPDGTKFSGFREFRELLARDQDVLAKSFATKLLIFATGREMGFSDRSEIDRIVDASRAKGHGIRDLIELVVLSKAFRSK